MLYKPDGCELVSYSSAGIRLSDHRPVYATFVADVKDTNVVDVGEIENIGVTESQVCVIS